MEPFHVFLGPHLSMSFARILFIFRITSSTINELSKWQLRLLPLMQTIEYMDPRVITACRQLANHTGRISKKLTTSDSIQHSYSYEKHKALHTIKEINSWQC